LAEPSHAIRPAQQQAPGGERFPPGALLRDTQDGTSHPREDARDIIDLLLRQLQSFRQRVHALGCPNPATQ
jgi:hypothetical protein